MARVIGVVALLLGAVGALFFVPRRADLAPLETSYWYWHTPFEISSKQRESLRSRGVERIFVRAGTFSNDGKRFVLIQPQEWRGKTDLEVHLVFNFDGGAVRHFGVFRVEDMARDIASRISRQVDSAERDGIRVAGIQFDLDSPTRLLSRYADLISQIKAKIGRPFTYSATALMSWLGTEGARILSRQVDFLVPQAYEGATGKSIDTVRPVFDPEELRRLLPRAEDLECPIYVGIPAYGHAFLFDEKGKLVDMYRGLSPEDAIRHPSFRLESAYPATRTGQQALGAADWVGEEIVKLRAVRPALDGRGVGYHLAYTIPTPEVTDRARAIVAENRPSNCRGIIVYRLPDDDSSMALPVEKGMTPPELKIAVSTGRDVFDAIETESRETPTDVFLEVRNAGGQPTFVAPDAVTVEVVFDASEIEDVRLRDALSAEFLTNDGTVTERPGRESTGILLCLPYLRAGESAEIGPIRLSTDQARCATLRWTVRLQNGMDEQRGNAIVKLEIGR